MKEHKYIIYGLVDPRNNDLFYIGKSCYGLDKAKRHTRAWSLAESASLKNEKIMSILAADLVPEIKVFKVCKTKRELFCQETILIRALSKSKTLLNVVNNRECRKNTKETESTETI